MNALLLLAAGHAGHLLRRRNRHGRQHLPGRPQRRAHADAVERRPQRRLLARQSAAPLPAGQSSIPEYHYEAINVEAQQNNPHSLLWWMKRLLALRKQLRALGRGTTRVPASRRTGASWPSCARWQDERVLVVANLSRFAQCAELDLGSTRHGSAGSVRQIDFSADHGDALLSFARAARLPLVRAAAAGSRAGEPRDLAHARTGEPPAVRVESLGERLHRGAPAKSSTPCCRCSCASRRWFRGGKRRDPRGRDSRPRPFPQIQLVPADHPRRLHRWRSRILRRGAVGFRRRRRSEPISCWSPPASDAGDGDAGVLGQRVPQSRVLPRNCSAAILRRRRYRGEAGEIVRLAHARLSRPVGHGPSRNGARHGQGRPGQHHRVLRRPPRPEIPAQSGSGSHTPSGRSEPCWPRSASPTRRRLPAPSITEPSDGEPMALALVHGFVRQGIEAWQYTQDHLGIFFEQPWPAGRRIRRPARSRAGARADRLLPRSGPLLGNRTAELHRVLAAQVATLLSRPSSSPISTGTASTTASWPARTASPRRSAPSWRNCPTARAAPRPVTARQPLVDPRNPALPPRPAHLRHAHPHPRRLSPGPGPLHRQGPRDHRFRRRPRASAERTPPQALAPRRCRRNDRTPSITSLTPRCSEKRRE